MSQEHGVLSEFFRWIVAALRERLSPAEFQELIDRSVATGPQNDSEARSEPDDRGGEKGN